ncbi:MAG: hypothetical protein RL120_08920 [Gammaproteobacteria bacterium]
MVIISRTAWLYALVITLLVFQLPATAQTPESSWLNIVRQTPYAESQGVASNLATIRQWVLFGNGFCDEPRRHLLYDRRGRFLGYIESAETASETIARLNTTRQRIVEEKNLTGWSPGSPGNSGYPFALSCDQPFVDIDEAISRLTGAQEKYRLWGTWDNISVGTPEDQVSLIELFKTVYRYRREQGRFSFSDSVLPTLLGKVIIESGGVQDALSAASARGIMQLTPQVLQDCNVPNRFRLHRIVQVDCALRLMEQNHRNLQEPFTTVFGELPRKKQSELYNLLLTQAYQVGVGRVTELLLDEELGRAAQYFAANQEQFSAMDILVGMIYHNLGRRDLGLRTLYYVTDINLAQQALCASTAMAGDPWCEP